MQQTITKNVFGGMVATTIMVFSCGAQAVSLPIADASVDLFGYARLNASYDINEDIAFPSRSGGFSLLGGADEDIEGHFGMDAYESRLGLRIATEEGYSVTVEGDFLGGGGGQLRLRHAYGEYKGWLAGQTWSNFSSFVGYTPTLDFDATPGLAGRLDRVTQIRYTTGNLSLAVEDAAPAVAEMADERIRVALPSVSAKYEGQVDELRYAVGSYLHQVNVDDGVMDDSVIGFAGFLAASFNALNHLTLHGVANFSEGAGVGLYRSGYDAFVEDAYLDGDSLERIFGYGASLGASVGIGRGQSLNLTYGFTTSDWDDAEADLGKAAVADRHKTNEKALINYIWTPVSGTMMGVEYAYMKRKLVSGDTAAANRLIFSMEYRF